MPRRRASLWTDSLGAEFNLIDVRQLKEYKAGHLPGAQLIPLGDLEKRSTELDPNLPTLVY